MHTATTLPLVLYSENPTPNPTTTTTTERDEPRRRANERRRPNPPPAARYFLFDFFWTTQFLAAFGEITLACVFAKWYFTYDEQVRLYCYYYYY